LATTIAPPLLSPTCRSIAVTEAAPQSAGISNIGGGPVAVASAGEAMALSNADTQANERVGIPN
jgi:hypothetical protein